MAFIKTQTGRENLLYKNVRYYIIKLLGTQEYKIYAAKSLVWTFQRFFSKQVLVEKYLQDLHVYQKVYHHHLHICLNAS